jgi:ketosteroid isomerase-like protein
MRAALPDDFVFDDHRRTGLGRLEGADAYLPAVAAVFEQSPDAIGETLHYLEVDTHGCLSVTRLFGTLVDGGPFENVAVQISHLRGSRFVAVELFELEDLERARARFDELRPDPLRIPPNAASRTRDRCFAAAAADDWAALRALACERFVFEDRSKAALLSGDLDPWIESVRYLQSEGGTPTRERIGTAGERIVIERITWTEAPTSRFELEHLVVVEVDAEGRFAASIKFDPDDRAAAFLEAELRFAAGEAGGARGLGLFGGAFVRRDWQAFRAAIAPDVTIRDHRVLGFFENVDSDRWVDSVRILPELAPDMSVESFRMLAWNAHGHVAATRVVGTMRDGGPFEYPFVRVIVTDGDRIRHFEIFPVDDADRAVAHFEELCTELPSAAA